MHPPTRGPEDLDLRYFESQPLQTHLHTYPKKQPIVVICNPSSLLPTPSEGACTFAQRVHDKGG